MMSDVKRRVAPAVAVALIAAGGTVYALDRSDDRVVRLEITTTSSAVVVAVARSAWRGALLEKSESVSRFRAYEVRLAPGEPAEFVLIGAQDAPESRQSVACRITVDGHEVDSARRVVRRGEHKEVKCRHEEVG